MVLIIHYMHVKGLTSVTRRCIENSRTRKFVNERVHQVENYTVNYISIINYIR